MSIQQIPLTAPEGVTLATARKYCPRNLRVVPTLAPLTVTENGTYQVPEGFAGFGTVTVNVSAESGGAQDGGTESGGTESGGTEGGVTDPDTPSLEDPDDPASGGESTDPDTPADPTSCEHPAEAQSELLVREATCAETGELRRECTLCGHVETVTLPTIDHTYVETVLPPANEGEESVTVRTCTVCGHVSAT